MAWKSREDTITIYVKKILKWMGKIFQNNCEKKKGYSNDNIIRKEVDVISKEK